METDLPWGNLGDPTENKIIPGLPNFGDLGSSNINPKRQNQGVNHQKLSCPPVKPKIEAPQMSPLDENTSDEKVTKPKDEIKNEFEESAATSNSRFF